MPWLLCIPPLGTSLWYALSKRLSGLQYQCAHTGEEKDFFLLSSDLTVLPQSSGHAKSVSNKICWKN